MPFPRVTSTTSAAASATSSVADLSDVQSTVGASSAPRGGASGSGLQGVFRGAAQTPLKAPSPHDLQTLERLEMKCGMRLGEIEENGWGSVDALKFFEELDDHTTKAVFILGSAHTDAQKVTSTAYKAYNDYASTEGADSKTLMVACGLTHGMCVKTFGPQDTITTEMAAKFFNLSKEDLNVSMNSIPGGGSRDEALTKARGLMSFVAGLGKTGIIPQEFGSKYHDMLCYLGGQFKAHDELDKAALCHEEALGLSQLKFSNDHPTVRGNAYKCATAYVGSAEQALGAGDVGKAVSSAEKAVQVCSVILGPRDKHTGKIVNRGLPVIEGAAVHLSSAGQAGDAAECMQKALQMALAHLGEGHATTQRLRSHLAPIPE